jgi:hypothetical protein
MRMRHLTIAVALCLTACAPTAPQRHVELERPTEHLAWAERAPATSQRAIERLQQGQERLDALYAATPGWRGAVPGADPDALEALYEAAAQDGQRRGVTDALLQRQQIEDFLTRHEEPIAWRIQGGVAARLKKDGCLCEVNQAGVVRYALREETTRRLNDEVRALSLAHTRLAEGPWDKRQREALEPQLDALTLGAFFVYVEAPALERELGNLQRDRDDLEETISEALQRQQARASDAKASRADRRDAEKRAQELQAALDQLKATHEAASPLLDKLEERQKERIAAWDKHLRALLNP